VATRRSSGLGTMYPALSSSPTTSAMAMAAAAARSRRHRPETVFAYAKASGRNFQTLFATIAWPEMELMQLLRNYGSDLRDRRSKPYFRRLRAITMRCTWLVPS
jgi:hypothetical protein